MENLKAKTKVELEELLERQNKVIRNANLIKRLPDKGAKVKESLHQLKEELKQRSEVIDTTDLLQRMAIGDVRDDAEEDNLKQFINPACNVTVERMKAASADSSYDRVIKIGKSTNNMFKPNSTVKHESVKVLPQESIESLGLPTVQKDNSSSKKGVSAVIESCKVRHQVKYGYDDSLYVNRAKSTESKPAKLINIDESISLQVKQEEKFKKLQASHILANRQHIKTAKFSPEGTFSPRIVSGSISDQSDNEEERDDIDYPD